MAHDWFTPSELADLALPGLSQHRQAVSRKATSEGWKSRPRAGRGGGQEYHVSALPEAARVELARRSASDAAEAGRTVGARLDVAQRLDARADAATREEALATVPHLPPTDARRMNARLDVLTRLAAFQQSLGLADRPAAERFALAYTRGEIEVGQGVRHELGESVSWRTLLRWKAAMQRQGMAALAGNYGSRSARVYTSAVDADPDIHDFVVALLAESPHASARHIEQGLQARFAGRPLPGLRAIQRFVDTWKTQNKGLYARLANPDGWRSSHLVAFGSQSEGIVRLNQRWELDSTPADVVLADGSRHALLGVIDVYSRRLRILVSRTSKGTAIAALLRRAILEWGVPEEIKTDNGKDYTSIYLTTAVEGLGIRQLLCTPFSPQQKPHIERAFKTFSHGLLELAPGFIGHDVAQRQAVRSRASFADRIMGKQGEDVTLRMSAEELQAFCDDWCDRVYAHEIHSALGQSPFQRVAAWREPVRRLTNERALDVLLQVAPGGGSRVVTKKGLAIDGAIYLHEALGEVVGERVAVRYDEADLGRMFVFSLDGTFLCVAENPERTGLSLADVAAGARARQAAILKEGMRSIKAAQREVKPATVAAEILESRALETHGLRLLPPPSEDHTTAALDAAAQAADARHELIHRPAVRPVSISDEQRRAAEAWEAEQAQAREMAAAIERDLMARSSALFAEEARTSRVYHNDFDRYTDLRDRSAAGERLSDVDAAFVAAMEVTLGACAATG